MRLTTKGRYAIRALMDIAARQHHGAVSLSDISQRQKISQSYLEQLFSKLRQHGIVKSVRGPGGGYKINGDMNEITIAAIIEAVDKGCLDATESCKKSCCQQDPAECLTHDLWCELTGIVHNFLKQKTLASILKDIHHKQEQTLAFGERQ